MASPQIRNVATIAGNLCQEPRCWYYRNPENTFDCLRKGGRWCDALFAENRYHSIFGGMCVSAAPCVTGCPIHNDIPAYMAKLRAGELDEAVAILLRTNPLPAIMGRACAHSCEAECNRFDYDEPVSIRDVERTLGDYALEHADAFYRAPGTESGKTVAVVGAGPAGLTAAYFLRKQGHAVTVYDRMPEAGGMLTYSIPAYRLPKAVVRAQVRRWQGMGIRFELGVERRRPRPDLERPPRAATASVFLATGLWNGKKLRLERGELLDSGLEFLIDVQRGVPRPVGERVLVIGGGSVAVDVAITARRSGAAEVAMACLESLDDHARHPGGYRAGARGRDHHPALVGAPARRGARREAGRHGVRALHLGLRQGRAFRAGLRSGGHDRHRGGPDPGRHRAGRGPLVRRARRCGPSAGSSSADKRTAATSLDGVFAGGDVTGGPATVVQAMAAGQRAAASIDAYLAGAQARGRARPERARSGWSSTRTRCRPAERDPDAAAARAAAHAAGRGLRDPGAGGDGAGADPLRQLRLRGGQRLGPRAGPRRAGRAGQDHAAHAGGRGALRRGPEQDDGAWRRTS